MPKNPIREYEFIVPESVGVFGAPVVRFVTSARQAGLSGRWLGKDLIIVAGSALANPKGSDFPRAVSWLSTRSAD